MSGHCRILCTSVGNDGFQAIRRALRENPGIRVCGADTNRFAYGLYLADAGYCVPSRDQPEMLVAELLDICLRENIGLLLPLSTEDLMFYAARRDCFEKAGIRVAASPLEAVDIANHKHRLIASAAAFGLPVPDNVIVHTFPDFKQALIDFGVQRRQVVVKREYSTGAQGVKIVVPGMKAEHRMFARDNISVPVEDLLRWSEQLEPFPSLMVSEFLDMKHSVDIFLEHGHAQCAVVRTELVRLYGMSVVGEVVSEPEIEALATAITERLGLCYTVNVEIGRDGHGRPKLVEINPRFPATIDHTVMAGCNMPLWTVYSALGQPIKIRRPTIGTRFVRHWTSFSPKQVWLDLDKPDPTPTAVHKDGFI